ncbi:homeobox protein MSH-D-like [Aplysia californica]|uniref:Homeobox protein MSH-D-like n=1 Tax=Aplysia californica TaxID=6500 RepID=A0ABM0JRI2_APLCA|nr:homeobox protein MSH-D-like [Aplysia californica]
MFANINKSVFFSLRNPDISNAIQRFSEDISSERQSYNNFSPLNLTMSSLPPGQPSPRHSWDAQTGETITSVDSNNSCVLGNAVGEHSATTPPSPKLLKKPELTFSIERILGLNSSRGSGLTPSDRATREFSRESHSAYDADFNGDEDDLDDDDETIDVDDSGPAGHGHEQSSLIFQGEFSSPPREQETPKYQWLQCTRYHPPKLQRSKKNEGTKKRKLGRNPRVPFTQHQVVVLEEKFRRTHYLSSMDVAELSAALSLTETRVKIWFQNRRARERRDKEATQRTHNTMVQKAFQPLSIPTVAWPMPSPMTSSNYVQYQQVLEFRPHCLTSAFGLYNANSGDKDNTVLSCRGESPPSTVS